MKASSASSPLGKLHFPIPPPREDTKDVFCKAKQKHAGREETLVSELVQEGRLGRGTEVLEEKGAARTPGAGRKAVERDISMELFSLTVPDPALSPHKRSPPEGSSCSSCFSSK